ncbi:hypothetical protein A3A95_00655 [Candidatus Nomurabacteria bacterium RIFCSPLOWO2_01_FULL_39_18]|uniref:Uncharacterized protein n=1 Tax=Candidatus Nomurabacteria bacterium RIFCSPHIGHO2_01_FULL_40_24b TaxID=1801739 RepID=A0A1F6V8P5_9BACT|nr:MAG: hypothetical protein A2647_01575 [Candidatus Nomurabacteria bacterium RIFCSPHIGHO2_01_FULL_40_24b]OGI89801.1 MAG: hypothetical protein A3A95_00655 [Candidatus Nomurabacteria bacterium RIFCSPLOWO2_01_FULL_39_18]
MEYDPTKPPSSLEDRKKRELSFEAGLAESLKRIREILKNKDIAVVAFSATGRGVGKSRLATEIATALLADNVLGYIEHHPADLTEDDFERIANIISDHSLGKVVFIFDQCDWDVLDAKFRLKCDEIVKRALKNTEWRTDKIDLWIGISTPTQPFKDKDPFPDILINNELAKTE